MSTVAATATTDFFGAPARPLKIGSVPWLRNRSKYVLIGVLVLLVNFPKYLTNVINANISNPDMAETLMVPIDVVQWILRVLIGSDPAGFFGRAITTAFFLLWMFFGLVLILCIRQRSLRMLGWGAGGMLAGYFALHLLAWLAVAVVVTVGAAVFVFGWVGSTIAAIFGFIFGNALLLLLLAAASLLAFLARFQPARLRAAWQLLQTAVRQHLRKVVVGAAAGLIAIWLVPLFYRWVLVPLWNYVIAPVLTWLGWLFGWAAAIVGVLLAVVVGSAIILLALALIGSLLVLQLQACWHGGRNRRLMLVAGFALGTALTLIAFVSFATPAVADSLNTSWSSARAALGLGGGTSEFITGSFEAFLPGSVERFALMNMTDLQAPAFDCLVFLAMTTLAVLSVLSKVLAPSAAEEEPVTLTFVAAEFATMVSGLFVALVLAVASSATGDSHA